MLKLFGDADPPLYEAAQRAFSAARATAANSSHESSGGSGAGAATDGASMGDGAFKGDGASKGVSTSLDEPVWSGMVRIHCAAGHAERALSLLDEMSAASVEPRLRSFSPLISSAAANADHALAADACRRIQKAGISPGPGKSKKQQSAHTRPHLSPICHTRVCFFACITRHLFSLSSHEQPSSSRSQSSIRR